MPHLWDAWPSAGWWVPATSGGGNFATSDPWVPEELVAIDFVDPGREDETRVVVPRVAAPFFRAEDPTPIPNPRSHAPNPTCQLLEQKNNLLF